MPARERLTTGMRIRGSVARRAVFGAGLALIFAAAFCSATTYRASALGETRTLSMYNIHTKETITVTFKRDGKYDPDALKKLNTFMRDWRANKETNMDPALIDLIWTLHQELGSTQPVNLICGLRTRRDQRGLATEGRRPGQAQPAHSRQSGRYHLPRCSREGSQELRARPRTRRRRLLPDLGRSVCACRHRQCPHVAAAYRGSSWRPSSPRATPNICRPMATRSRLRTTSSP